VSAVQRRKLMPAAVLVAGVVCLLLAWNTNGWADSGDLTDPLIGNQQAIAEGKDLYRRHCFVCHLHAGGRGPNLFASTLTDEQFATTVVQGRGMMPGWGLRLSLDEIWRIRAFVRSTDKYES
jgi:mono/diheme cytochrome c family protein